jgi:hypothetical protein
MRLSDLPRTSIPWLATALLACTSGGVSCAQGVGGSTGTPISTTNPGDDDNATGDDDQNGDDNVNADSGAFGQNDSGGDDGAPGREAGADGGATDSGSDGGSSAPICPDVISGTLTIVEVMIVSRSGNLGSDRGEWVELLNPSSNCAVELTNITVTSPRGTSGADTATLNDGYRVGPGQTVLVTDSLSATDNNGLTGQIYTWNSSDVLANGGDSVSVLRGTSVLNTFSYTTSTVNIEDGVSVELPARCSTTKAGDLIYWQAATAGFGTATCGAAGASACQGTPNAPNDDVSSTPECE